MKGGAARGGAGGAGGGAARGRGRGRRACQPAVVPAPRSEPGWGQPHGLQVPGGQWAPIVTLPAPTPGLGLPSEKLSATSAQRKAAGASAWVPEDKGTPPAPRTPALNLVRPPLLVPTSRPSPASLGRRGQVTRGSGATCPRCSCPVVGPWSLVARGGGRVRLFQLARFAAAAKMRRVDLVLWRRWGLAPEQPTLQVFPVQDGVGGFFSCGVPERDLPKAGTNEWRRLPIHDQAQVA